MSISTSCRRLATAGIVVVAAAAALNVVPGVASAAGLGSYTVTGTAVAADGTPTTYIPAGTAVTFDVTFTNNSVPSSADVLDAASVTLPAGFTAISVPTTVTDSESETWNLSVSGQTVSGSTTIGLLPVGESVTFPITATTPSTLGGFTFSTSASGLIGGATGQSAFSNSGSNPTFTTFTATYTCAPATTCTEPFVGPANNTQISVTDYNGGSEDYIGVQAPSPVTPGCAVSTKVTPVAYETTDHTSTLDVKDFLPESTGKTLPKKSASASICWQQDSPFTSSGSSGTTTVNGITQYYGDLPSCGTTPVAPCIKSVTAETTTTSSCKTETLGYLYDIDGTPGDPINIPVGGLGL